MIETRRLFALLIDGDNAQAVLIPQMLEKLDEYGEALLLQVYHTKASIERWEQVARDYSIEPIWVPNNITGKNSVDIALVMAAMILRYERTDINGFCIVASDSDYSRLARYLKSEERFVLGFGEQRTPPSFRSACSEFVDITSLIQVKAPAAVITDSKPLLLANEATTQSQPTTPSANAVSAAPSANAVPAAPPATHTSSPSISAQQVTPAHKMPPDAAFARLLVKAYKQAFEKGAHNSRGGILLRDIRAEMLSLDPEFTSQEYQQMPRLVSKIKALVTIYPDLITIEELADAKPVTHILYPVRPLDKYIEAYKYAVKTLAQQEGDGWITLSTLGDVFHKFYPDYKYLTYRGVSYNQLRKVVEQLVTDYPAVVECRQGKHNLLFRVKPGATALLKNL